MKLECENSTSEVLVKNETKVTDAKERGLKHTVNGVVRRSSSVPNKKK